MKLHEVIEQVAKGQGKVYGYAEGNGKSDARSFAVRYSEGQLDNDGLSKMVLWVHTHENPTGYPVPSVPIELDWKVLVVD